MTKQKVRQDIYFGVRGMDRLQRLVEDEGIDASTIIRDALVKREQSKVAFQQQVRTAVLNLAETIDIPLGTLAPSERKTLRKGVNEARQRLAALLGSDFAARGIEEALRQHLQGSIEEAPLKLTPIDRDHLYSVSQAERFLAFLQGHSPELLPATVHWRQAHEEEGLDAHTVLELARRFPNGELAVAFEKQYIVVREDPWEEKTTGECALAYIAPELAAQWQRFLQS